MHIHTFNTLNTCSASTLCMHALNSCALFAVLNTMTCGVQGSAKRWKKFTDSECPEKEKFPGEWKNKNSLQKLCMMRALRPDRMTYAVTYATTSHTIHKSLTHTHTLQTVCG